MKREKLFIFYFFVFFWLSMVISNSCKKESPALTNEEKLTQHENKIISKIDEFMPTQIASMLEDHFNSIRSEQDYALYLDSVETSIDELKSAIQLNFSLDEYKKTLNNSLLDLQKKNSLGCSGLGYAKGSEIDVTVAGKVGVGIVAGLQAAGGGGVKTIYDFVNLERQVYYYIFCSNGYSFGVGATAALSASVGFSGVNELITGIKYHGNSSGFNKFAGPGLSTSYSLSSDLATLFGIDISIGIGNSSNAVADFSGVGNLMDCPQNMVVIENGTKEYCFSVSGSLSADIGADIALAYSSDLIGSYSYGVADTYKKFSRRRPLAASKMATEILLAGPMPGIKSNSSGFDLVASTTAIIYGFKDVSSCPAQIASIGTKVISNIKSTSAMSGGIIQDNGGSDVTARGVVWSTSENPTISNNIGITIDGQGNDEFISNLTNLNVNTIYYVRAYATNGAGTAYGSQVSFTTLSNSVTIPTYGLVAYYPFNGNANDQSGNNNNGTVSGATLTTDRHGFSNQAYLFNGVDNYIEISHSSTLNLSQQISISYWAKLETSAEYDYPYHIIEQYGCWGSGQRQADVNWGISTSVGDFYVWALNLEFDRFYHFVMTYNGSKLSIYVDGVLEESIDASGLLIQNSNDIFIGKYPFSDSNYFFDGTLDDIRIYNRALTDQEISALYNE